MFLMYNRIISNYPLLLLQKRNLFVNKNRNKNFPVYEKLPALLINKVLISKSMSNIIS